MAFSINLTPEQMMITIYCVIALFSIIICNMITKGFLFSYIFVAISRGRRVMVKARTPTEDYYAAGKLGDKHLKYKNRAKDNSLITLPEEYEQNSLYQFLQIWWIDVDEKKGCVISREYVSYPAVDPVKADYIYERALKKPMLGYFDPRIILIAVVVVGILAIYIIYLLTKTNTKLDALYYLVNSTASIIR